MQLVERTERERGARLTAGERQRERYRESVDRSRARTECESGKRREH